MTTLSPLSIALMMTVGVSTACSSASREQLTGKLESAETSTVTASRDSRPVDPTLFVDGALLSEVTTEDCTLNGGTTTTCYRLSIAGAPMNDAVAGPYCPPTITSTAEEGGTWFDGSGTVYDVDGEFIANLSELYNDDRWQMYDPATGEVNIIDGAEGCEVAGDPENSSGRDNFCLSCSLEALDGGLQKAILIPVEPVPRVSPTPVMGSNLGIALNGVFLGPPAPVDLILSTITLGVFDDCGGHANPHEGYHYHAANDCVEIVEQADGHAKMIGYAMDGYAIFAHLDPTGNPASELDECGGHEDDMRGYHYHAQAPGDNQIVACLQGERVEQARGGPGGGILATMAITGSPVMAADLSYPIVDTMQDICYDNSGTAIDCPGSGESLYGQDAQYSGTATAYVDNGDGTVSDTVTGLIWQQSPGNDRLQFAEAESYCATLELGGRNDWRVPGIKELYSLADFRGELLKPEQGTPTPYIDTSVFDFQYPRPPMVFAGQYWSSTLYVKGPIINDRNQGAFGFNFADGHIKAYGTGLDFFTGDEASNSGLANGPPDGKAPGNYVRCVSGEENVYGLNDFVDNNNGTVSDQASGLDWQQNDDGKRRDWAEALAYCETLDLAGHQDWRLPDSKELQSIVDYDKTDFPAIDESLFGITQDSETLDYWTSTTFGDIKSHANVIVFGKALSKAGNQSEYTDWHGAGAQRSSIKTLEGQSLTDEDLCSINACDVDRPDNLVRCVR